jgi:uncharacterized protein YbjT (DUF2867 family)
MADPNSGQKRSVIVGATGMVGGYALRYALEHHAVTSVTAIVRRKLGIPHPKLSEVFHRDFADCSALAQAVSGQDAAVFCLGAYTGAVSAAELRTITVGYTIEFARILRASSPEPAFSFLSGKGADPTGRSRMASRAIRERRKTHSSPHHSRACTSSGRRTSTRSNRAGNPISAIACCARSTPRFGYCSRTK